MTIDYCTVVRRRCTYYLHCCEAMLYNCTLLWGNIVHSTLWMRVRRGASTCHQMWPNYSNWPPRAAIIHINKTFNTFLLVSIFVFNFQDRLLFTQTESLPLVPISWKRSDEPELIYTFKFAIQRLHHLVIAAFSLYTGSFPIVLEHLCHHIWLPGRLQIQFCHSLHILDVKNLNARFFYF